MPTPFYHLSLAHDLLAAKEIPPLLRAEWPAFYFGNIAPDAQTLSGQSRFATHFFTVPMRDSTPAWQQMFRQFPGLARPASLPPAQAAFLAGYLCHLALDQLWITDIFDPVFGKPAESGALEERLFLHNVLRVYLDRLHLPRLQNGAGQVLKQAQPEQWLPFLSDESLGRWRDFVADQLIDGAAPQTVAVFAARMGRAPTDFESLLESPPAMQARIFDRLPLAALADFWARGLARSRELIADYLTH